MVEHTKEYLQFLSHWIYIHAEQVFGATTGVAVGYTTTPQYSANTDKLEHIAFIFVCGIAGAMGGTLWKYIVSLISKKNKDGKID